MADEPKEPPPPPPPPPPVPPKNIEFREGQIIKKRG